MSSPPRRYNLRRRNEPTQVKKENTRNGSNSNNKTKSKALDINHNIRDNDTGLEKVNNMSSLLNIGNTCYMNAVLYTLRFTLGFVHKLHHMAESTSQIIGPKSPEEVLTQNLHEVFLKLTQIELSGKIQPFRPNLFLDAVRTVNGIFDGSEQQDTHELLMSVLNSIQATGEMMKSAGHPEIIASESFFVEDFEGETAYATKCITCETVSEPMKEPMIGLSIPVDELEGRSQSNESFLHLLDKVYTEKFDCNDKYWCQVCLRFTEAYRKGSFPKLPRILIVQFKRFNSQLEKINTYVPTPLTLECFCLTCLSNRGSAKQHEYRLYSVIAHVGATMNRGHYIAFTRSLPHNNFCEDCQQGIDDRNQTKAEHTRCSGETCCSFKPEARLSSGEEMWYKCNDHKISAAPQHLFEQKLSKNLIKPYLLFYMRNDILDSK